MSITFSMICYIFSYQTVVEILRRKMEEILVITLRLG